MSTLEVKIVTLPPMRLLSAYGFGPSPEEMAGRKMSAFLKQKGLLEGYGSTYPHYGFNNPSPSSGSPNYGYEIWVAVPPEIEPEGEIRLVEFAGGMYAVTRFENLENIGRVWGELVKWRENSPYQHAGHQWLEHLLNPLETDPGKYIFELFLPIQS